MTTNNTASFSSTEMFRIPSEPCPLPSLGSDEESFVVLGKSLSPDMEDAESIEHIEPMGSSVIEESKKLLQNEIAALESMSLKKKQKLNNEDEVEDQQVIGEMEDSTVLPEMPKVDRGFETTNAISIATISSDLSSIEVQQKINQIIEENIHLKDTILQNNMSLKLQYERILAWQEDVKKVHDTHRNKIYEAKSCIDNLKKQKESMKQDLERYKDILKTKDEELITLTQVLREKERQSTERLLQTTEDNLKAFELDAANKKLMELEQQMKKITLDGQYVDKIKNLEEELRNVSMENEELKVQKDKLTGDVEKIAEYEKYIQDLEAELGRSKKQVEELNSEISTLGEREIAVNVTMDDLRRQISYYVQHQANLPSSEDLNMARTQLAEIQVTLTQVEHSRSAAYAQISTLVQQINKLNKELEETKAKGQQSDEMFALQTQLEIFKADFEAERTAKENIKEERDKLLEDIQNLQRRNQQLQEEIDMVREHSDYVVYPNTRRPASSRSNASDSPPLRRHACPVCGLQFRSVRLLEEHVELCISHRT